MKKLFITLMAGILCLLQQAVIKAETDEVRIPVSVTTTGNTSTNFTFEISSNSNAPLPSTASLTLGPNETGSFEGITFEKDGHYAYQIKQLIPSVQGRITYDTTVYDVNIDVYNADDQVVQIVYVRKDGLNQKVNAVTFKNIIHTPSSPETTDEQPAAPKRQRPGVPDTRDTFSTSILFITSIAAVCVFAASAHIRSNRDAE